MKSLKKLIGIFFIITFFCIIFLMLGCENKINNQITTEFGAEQDLNNDSKNDEENSFQEETSKNNKNDTKDLDNDSNEGDAAEDLDDQNKTDDNKGDNKEQKIYFSLLNCPEIIHFLDNGLPAEFNIEFLPLNTTEEFVVNIENKEIINFLDGKIYPLSVGQTLITIAAPLSENTDIVANCLVIVEPNETNLDLQISNKEGSLLQSGFKSGQKANGTYEIYTSQICSLKNLENVEILKSKEFVIINETKEYYQIEEIYYLTFDFYLLSERNTLQICRYDDYDNFSQKIYSDEFNFLSTNFIEELIINVERESKDEKIIYIEEQYILYFCADVELIEEVDETGFYNNYLIDIKDELNCDFENFAIMTDNANIIGIEKKNEFLKIFSKNTGHASLVIEALDGSGQSVNLNFEILAVEPEIQIEKIDLNTCLQEDLISYFENISFYEKNNLGVIDYYEISLKSKFAGQDYIYLNSTNANLGVTSNISRDENGNIVKNYIFESNIAGIYYVDLILNNEIFYTIEINVLSKNNYFKFSTDDIARDGVVYDFENKIITIHSLNSLEDKNIIFTCKTYNILHKEQEQNLIFSFDSNYCITEKINIEMIFLSIKKAGNFVLTITNGNLSVDFNILINE